MTLPFSNFAPADQRNQVRGVHGAPASPGGRDEAARDIRCGPPAGSPPRRPHRGTARRRRRPRPAGAAGICRAPSWTISSSGDKLAADPLVAFGSDSSATPFSVGVHFRTSATTPVLIRNVMTSRSSAGRCAGFRSPRRGPSTGSDHCSFAPGRPSRVALPCGGRLLPQRRKRISRDALCGRYVQPTAITPRETTRPARASLSTEISRHPLLHDAARGIERPPRALDGTIAPARCRERQ